MKNLSHFITEGRYADHIWGGFGGYDDIKPKIKPFVKQDGSDERYIGWAPLKVIIEAIFGGDIPDKNGYDSKKDNGIPKVNFTFDRNKDTTKMEPIKNLVKNTDKDTLFPFIVRHVEKEDGIWEDHIYVRIINPEQLIEISSYGSNIDDFIKYVSK